MSEHAFITGSEGFLGRHLTERLATDGISFTRYDRKLGVQDIRHRDTLRNALKDSGATVVYHLAALADVRSAFKQPQEQFQNNLLGTAVLLEAMRSAEVKQIVFTSSAVVYGDIQSGVLSESHAVGKQTSIYGAVKLASEALIEAYCAGYGFRADIFRLVSALGEGYRHGNVLDFYRKLQADPSQIHLLGTGREEKYYVYAGDVISAMQCARAVEHTGSERWNVSDDSPVTINDVLTDVCDELQLMPARSYEQTTWTGDLPSLVLDTRKLRSIGWEPTLDAGQGVRRTVRWFQEAGL